MHIICGDGKYGMERKRIWNVAWKRPVQLPASMAEARMAFRKRSMLVAASNPLHASILSWNVPILSWSISADAILSAYTIPIL
jgi:hypothetical protein